MRWVNGKGQVSVLQVQTDYPVVLFQEVYQKMNTFHLEVSVDHEIIEFFQIQYQLVISALLLDQENITAETARVLVAKHDRAFPQQFFDFGI